MKPDRLLVLILRLDALVLTTAFLAVFMPEAWMIASHDRLGMGEFPSSPLVSYLTRSIAVMYATRGLFVWLASTDTVRYEVLIRLIGWSNVLIGVFLLGIDLASGMPTFWTFGEGPPIAGVGFVILWAQRAAQRAGAE